MVNFHYKVISSLNFILIYCHHVLVTFYIYQETMKSDIHVFTLCLQPAIYEVLVLIGLSKNEGSCESAHMRRLARLHICADSPEPSLISWYTQRMDVDKDLDLNQDPKTNRWIRQHGYLRQAFAHMRYLPKCHVLIRICLSEAGRQAGRQGRGRQGRAGQSRQAGRQIFCSSSHPSEHWSGAL